MELMEVVYSPEVAQDGRFDGLNSRVGKIEGVLTEIDKRITPSEPRFVKWLPWIVVLVGNGILVALSGMFVDSHIDSKTNPIHTDMARSRG